MHHLASDDVFVSNVWIISVPEMDLYKLMWHPLFPLQSLEFHLVKLH